MCKRLRTRSANLSQFFKWFLVGMLMISTIVLMRLAIAVHQSPIPQAIFVLGGDSDRMEFAAQFWHSHSDLDIWISDFPIGENGNREIFRQAHVPESRVNFDGRATDTVTNFTSLVDVFLTKKLHHLYLITSDYHMKRASTIAAIVLGSRGIAITPLSVPAKTPKSESLLRVLRDVGRSLLWLLTGRSGASLNPHLQPNVYLNRIVNAGNIVATKKLCSSDSFQKRVGKETLPVGL